MFTNSQIEDTSFPRFEEVTFTDLPGKYLKVVVLDVALILLIPTVGLLAVNYFVDDFRPYFLTVFLIWIAIAVYAMIISIIGFYRKGYAFREHDVLYRTGVFAHIVRVIPFNRIQHVALHEGPISRFFGYARIKIYTAGAGAGDISIPGIPKETAQQIKQLLSGKIQTELE